jgi:putative molybdopterin biosynthesis protein
MSKENIYLTTIPVDEGLEIYLNRIKEVVEIQYEEIPVIDSLGRVCKNAVYGKYCSPLYNASAMDGIAVISSRTETASESNPVTLTEGEDYVEVDTGDPIHPPYDAVVMVEDLLEPKSENQTGNRVSIVDYASPWQHVRPIGEDIVTGEMILPSNHQIRPIDIGVMLSSGITTIEVIKKPKVAIIPTGSELIEPEETPGMGDIIESNSQMFVAMVREAGSIPYRFPPVDDEYEEIKKAISESVDTHDMVIVNAGSSAGREDYTPYVLRELGEVLIHGIAIKPGKPVILAIVNNKPVIGLPGYPVSAYIDLETFVLPVLAYMSGVKNKELETIEAVMTKRVVSSLKYKEYVRVKVGEVDGKLVATPLARGAGAAMSLVRSDGFCIIEQNHEGVEAGEKVKVAIHRPLDKIKNTIVVIGSHDLILDVLADMLPSMESKQQKDDKVVVDGSIRDNNLAGSSTVDNSIIGNSLVDSGVVGNSIGKRSHTYISSTHVGSMGGIMALNRQETHLAPIHLLDEKTGVYNVSYLERVTKKEPMALIKGVGRIQGLILKKGNPKKIVGLEDIVSCSFVNRQKGSGTRILLDYKLKELGIDKEKISGYLRESATHMAVAALVNSDSADAGLGILAAAKAFDLDFVEVAVEEYDFAIPVKFLELPQIKQLIKVLQSQEFKNKLEELGGYTYERIGEIVCL